MELLYDPSIPHLRIYSKEMKSLCQRDGYTLRLITALFTVAKTERKKKSLSTDEWIEKMWYTHKHTHHNVIIFRHKKGNLAICNNMNKYWGYYLKKYGYCIILLIFGILKEKRRYSHRKRYHICDNAKQGNEGIGWR